MPGAMHRGYSEYTFPFVFIILTTKKTRCSKVRGFTLATIEELGTVISTDILIIGGGIGGLVTAVKAKEANPEADVLIVEKQTAGWAGKATKIGGILAFLGPNNDGDKFLDFQVRSSGFYLNDQDLLSKYIKSTYSAIKDFGNWGTKLARTPEGKLLAFPNNFAPELSMTFIDIDLMLPIRAKARKMGTKFLDKIHVVELLTRKNKVIGAAGFDIVTGKFYIFRAKATILANGSCGYKVRRFWVAGTGDGIAAAYRAGAEMRNAEYGNLYGHTVYQDTDGGMVGHQFLFNTKGENLAQKYLPNSGPTGVFLPVPLAVGMETEITEGRGPIVFTPPPPQGGGYPQMGLPKISDWSRRMAEKEAKYGLPPGSKREIAIPLHGETSCIKVDHEMRTTLKGLWAIGDTSYAGSAVAGAVCSPPGITPGSGIMYAVVSAGWAGTSAARYVKDIPKNSLDYSEIKKLKADIFTPMQNGKVFLPGDAISALQEVTAPIKYNLRRSKERLNESIARVKELNEKLPELMAQDFHYLSKCHEVKSMVLCAELTFKSALMREESRGAHYREDYPNRDDKNWLKWVIVKQDSGKMKVGAQPIPIDKYKIKTADNH
jgi:succinate dehydrogenase/fumarate reductase flavoprotein subunit